MASVLTIEGSDCVSLHAWQIISNSCHTPSAWCLLPWLDDVYCRAHSDSLHFCLSHFCVIPFYYLLLRLASCNTLTKYARCALPSKLHLFAVHARARTENAAARRLGLCTPSVLELVAKHLHKNAAGTATCILWTWLATERPLSFCAFWEKG
jgi:hypothetical protein